MWMNFKLINLMSINFKLINLMSMNDKLVVFFNTFWCFVVPFVIMKFYRKKVTFIHLDVFNTFWCFLVSFGAF